MKRIFFLMTTLSLLVSACGIAAKQSTPSGAAVNPSPVAEVDLNATAAAMARQTIEAMPTPTLMPSNTPVVFTETPTGTFTPTASITSQVTATQTQNPILLTLTATLGTGTPATLSAGAPAILGSNTPATIIPMDVPVTATIDLSTPTETPYPRTYGTMPPDLPAGKVFLINKSKMDVTVSLHCTTKDGYITYIEYPVEGTIKVKAPAGKYHFVAWVGGKMYTGNFNLIVGGDATVIMFKDHVETK